MYDILVGFDWFWVFTGSQGASRLKAPMHQCPVFVTYVVEVLLFVSILEGFYLSLAPGHTQIRLFWSLEESRMPGHTHFVFSSV